MKRGNQEKNNINNTDHYFKRRFEGAEAQPGSHIWYNIEGALDATDVKRNVVFRNRFYRTSVALLLILLSYQLYDSIQSGTFTKEDQIIQSQNQPENIHCNSHYFVQQLSTFLHSGNIEDILHAQRQQQLFSSSAADRSAFSADVTNDRIAESRLSNQHAHIGASADDDSQQKIAKKPRSSKRLNLMRNQFPPQLNENSLPFLSKEDMQKTTAALLPEDFLASLSGLIDNDISLVNINIESTRNRARFESPQVYKEGFHFGFEVNGLYNELDGINMPTNTETPMDYRFEGGSGSRYGAFLGYDFTESMGVETGFFMSTHNYTLHGESNGWKYERNLRLDYIELPFLFRYKISGFSYRLNQTHGVTFKLGGTFNIFQGGQFDETHQLINEKEVFYSNSAGITGGVQYDLFIATNFLFSMNLRADLLTPIQNDYFMQKNIGAGASLRYFIPAQRRK